MIGHLQQEGFATAALCEVLEVHRSRYYAWLGGSHSCRAREDAGLTQDAGRKGNLPGRAFAGHEPTGTKLVLCRFGPYRKHGHFVGLSQAQLDPLDGHRLALRLWTCGHMRILVARESVAMKICREPNSLPRRPIKVKFGKLIFPLPGAPRATNNRG